MIRKCGERCKRGLLSQKDGALEQRVIAACTVRQAERKYSLSNHPEKSCHALFEFGASHASSCPVHIHFVCSLVSKFDNNTSRQKVCPIRSFVHSFTPSFIPSTKQAFLSRAARSCHVVTSPRPRRKINDAKVHTRFRTNCLIQKKLCIIPTRSSWQKHFSETELVREFFRMALLVGARRGPFF